ncbi:MAG: quinone-dependent dihydroorotate dehydrogenase [Gammaproteobacteria bacterium]|nr:quinone-dependent dihydroorotate dehydrogenase [Gammaproteobacteria bacterium]
MSAYRWLRPALFALDAEVSHDIVLRALGFASRHPALLARIEHRYRARIPDDPVKAMGLTFANPVGLAAGLDKQASAAPALCAPGFGFVELGTVTPEPQPGNKRPRMFRLTADGAIINRMGFNSRGLDVFLHNLRRYRPRCVTGINIGKNAATPMERALDDYLIGLRAVYDDADYVTVNISSPNTAGLRDLQQDTGLRVLLAGLKRCRFELSDRVGRRVPIAIKIAPDLEGDEVAAIARLCIEYGMDAVIATNTTVTRPVPAGRKYADESGGLSGAPLAARSTEVVAELSRALDGALPIIAAGGIMSGADAVERLQAGATLVQLYTGLVYRGPDLVAEVAEAVRRYRQGSH